MNAKTITSAVLLGLSGAALAQVSGANDPKLGNAPTANGAAPAGNSAADPTGNVADPGKPGTH